MISLGADGSGYRFYRQFFADAGYPDAEYTLCEGRIPCAVAVLQKREEPA